jgi:hypothetical protein
MICFQKVAQVEEEDSHYYNARPLLLPPVQSALFSIMWHSNTPTAIRPTERQSFLTYILRCIKVPDSRAFCNMRNELLDVQETF